MHSVNENPKLSYTYMRSADRLSLFFPSLPFTLQRYALQLSAVVLLAAHLGIFIFIRISDVFLHFFPRCCSIPCIGNAMRGTFAEAESLRFESFFSFASLYICRFLYTRRGIALLGIICATRPNNSSNLLVTRTSQFRKSLMRCTGVNKVSELQLR